MFKHGFAPKTGDGFRKLLRRFPMHLRRRIIAINEGFYRLTRLIIFLVRRIRRCRRNAAFADNFDKTDSMRTKRLNGFAIDEMRKTAAVRI